jgi:hypothetical protein
MSIDDTLTTPYSHVFNFVYGRDLGRNFGWRWRTSGVRGATS